MTPLINFISRHFKKILLICTLVVVFSAASVFYCDSLVYKKSAAFHSNDISTIPNKRVGLLLGTSKFNSNGLINLYYKYRISAALDLLKSGKIAYLIISGDNSRHSYNEPEMMKQDLIAAGIDSSKIYLDYAGFRTFDSMVRLKEIFGITDVIVISQKFHNERAIYIAARLGISAFGYNAQDIPRSQGIKIIIREKFARVKVVLDFLLGIKPKFLGEKIMLPG